MSDKQYILAIDAGTGSIRAVVFDLEGNQKASAAREWLHKEDPRYKGSMNFDWVHNRILLSECIREVLAIVPAALIAGISTTSMREGIVLYDKNGEELWACANVDARSCKEVTDLVKHDGLEKKLYTTSGQSFALDAIPRLLWIKNHQPEVYKHIHRLSMINDWLIYKMTGTLSVEPSNGCTAGLFNLKTRDWDNDLLRTCGIDKELCSTVTECGCLVGTVSSLFSRETGLHSGTPVFAGGGDSQCGCIGIGVVEQNQAAVLGGSFWQYEYNTAQACMPEDGSIRINCHAVPNLLQYEAIAFKPGLILRWYRDAFCELEKIEAERQQCSVYRLMDVQAEKIPAGCYGMLTAFSDVMNFTAWKHAAPTFANFTLSPEQSNRYTFYRGILENTALVTKGHVELVYKATGRFPAAITFAGGAAQSTLWCRILADTLGLPIAVPKVKEASALGAAILAACGLQYFRSIQDAVRHMVKIETRYTPDMEKNSIYARLYDTWRQFYAAQLSLCNAGTTQSLWAAPGVQ